MMELELTEREAAVVSLALEQAAAQARDLGHRLIEDTNARQAGFNSYDTAARMDQVRARIDSVFPPDEDEDGPPFDELGERSDDEGDDDPFEED